jgi:hypothetical protein
VGDVAVFMNLPGGGGLSLGFCRYADVLLLGFGWSIMLDRVAKLLELELGMKLEVVGTLF